MLAITPPQFYSQWPPAAGSYLGHNWQHSGRIRKLNVALCLCLNLRAGPMPMAKPMATQMTGPYSPASRSPRGLPSGSPRLLPATTSPSPLPRRASPEPSQKRSRAQPPRHPDRSDDVVLSDEVVRGGPAALPAALPAAAVVRQLVRGARAACDLGHHGQGGPAGSSVAACCGVMSTERRAGGR